MGDGRERDGVHTFEASLAYRISSRSAREGETLSQKTRPTNQTNNQKTTQDQLARMSSCKQKGHLEKHQQSLLANGVYCVSLLMIHKYGNHVESDSPHTLSSNEGTWDRSQDHGK